MNCATSGTGPLTHLRLLAVIVQGRGPIGHCHRLAHREKRDAEIPRALRHPDTKVARGGTAAAPRQPPESFSAKYASASFAEPAAGADPAAAVEPGAASRRRHSKPCFSFQAAVRLLEARVADRRGRMEELHSRRVADAETGEAGAWAQRSKRGGFIRRAAP